MQFRIREILLLRLHAAAIGCRGISRTDFRWDDEQGIDGLFVLETNTQPGMTPLSLVPEQAKHVGMSYEDLVETIIADALGIEGGDDGAQGQA